MSSKSRSARLSGESRLSSWAGRWTSTRRSVATSDVTMGGSWISVTTRSAALMSCSLRIRSGQGPCPRELGPKRRSGGESLGRPGPFVRFLGLMVAGALAAALVVLGLLVDVAVLDLVGRAAARLVGGTAGLLGHVGSTTAVRDG